MAGIQRFVTYLYSYEGNEKLHNTGFAKVEIRGGQCRMEIHLKGAVPVGTTSSIYLFSRDQELIHAVEIGKIRFAGGSGDFKGVFSCEEIGGSPYGMSNMDGIYIPIDDAHMFASQWDEEGIDRGRIRLWEPEKTEETVKEEPAEKAEEKAETAEKAEEKAESAEKAEEKAEPAEKVEEKTGPAESAQQQDVSVQATAIPQRAFYAADAVQGTLLDAFLKLQRSRQKIEVFETGKRQVNGIHIELRDIKELPKQNWNIANNSFLLHGFFNYKYLLLGKKVEGGKETVFIGVPGVYHNQERIMAAMFGFPEFLPRRSASEAEKEIFGYWCHALLV